MRTILAVLLLSISALSLAKDKQVYAPLPDKVTSAKTVFIDNQTGHPESMDMAFAELKTWNRFVIVTDPAKADLIFRFTMHTEDSPISTVIIPIGNMAAASSSSGKTGFTTLSIRDSSSSELWTVTRPWGRDIKHSATKECIGELHKRFPKAEAK